MTAKFLLRLPDDLSRAVRARATASRRSINSEMLHLLELGLLASTTSVTLPSESAETLRALLPR